jgi:ribonuclease BN (tRNA processing enzyme)
VTRPPPGQTPEVCPRRRRRSDSLLRVPAADRLIARVPNAKDLKPSIGVHLSSREEGGRLAQTAGVKTLVLSPLMPSDDPEVADPMWKDAASTHFRGTVILRNDLLGI